jgi:hypothetical protein
MTAVDWCSRTAVLYAGSPDAALAKAAFSRAIVFICALLQEDVG